MEAEMWARTSGYIRESGSGYKCDPHNELDFIHPTCPAEDAESAQRDPATRLALAFAHVNQLMIMVCMVQGPSAVGSAIGLYDPNRLGDPLVRGDTGRPQVVEPAEDIIVPPVREREL